MKPCSQSCNVYSILMGYIWKSTEMAWLVPFIYPQQGHKEAQIYNSSQDQWQPCTTVPKDLVQVLPGTAHGSYLSTWGCFDTLPRKNSPSALKEERGHPLSHAFQFPVCGSICQKRQSSKDGGRSSSQAPLLWAAPGKQKLGFPNYRQLQAGGVTFQFCFQRKIIN